MKLYFLRRILAIIPTFLGITIIVFIILNMAPGGPVEQMIRQIRFGGAGDRGGVSSGKASSVARDSGVTQEVIESLKRQYGFDKPIILNLRIDDRRTGSIDDIARVILSLDDAPSGFAYGTLEKRGSLVINYLIPALLHPEGSDYGLIELISDNGLDSLEKHLSSLIAIPDEYQPLDKQTELVQKGLLSATDLIRMVFDSPPERRLSLIRSARILLLQATGHPGIIHWDWKNPISEPLLTLLAEYTGETSVLTRESLSEWWVQNMVYYDPSRIKDALAGYFSAEIGAREFLLQSGACAVPGLMQFRDELPVEMNSKFMELLGQLAGETLDLPLPSSPTGAKYDTVKTWWKTHRLYYEELRITEKAKLAFTYTRYGIWLKNILTLDFGQSFTYDQPVIDVILSKMPVSIQFGVTSFILTYLVCIPLGIWKAVRDGSSFDYLTSILLFLMWSIPGFMLAVLLIVFFGGGSFLDVIPIGGLFSDNYFEMGFYSKIADRIHHFIAPLICYMIAEFTTLTILMKNSIIEEISKDYCRTARAKGLSERAVYLKHALRNALIPIATGIGGFLGIFFAGSMLLEMIFNLDGMGLLGYASVLSRDFNVIMGDLVIISLITLAGNIISDFIYTVVDPRIDFGKESV